MSIDKYGTFSVSDDVVTVEQLHRAYRIAGQHLKVLRRSLKLEQNIWELHGKGLPVQPLHEKSYEVPYHI